MTLPMHTLLWNKRKTQAALRKMEKAGYEIYKFSRPLGYQVCTVVDGVHCIIFKATTRKSAKEYVCQVAQDFLHEIEPEEPAKLNLYTVAVVGSEGLEGRNVYEEKSIQNVVRKIKKLEEDAPLDMMNELDFKGDFISNDNKVAEVTVEEQTHYILFAKELGE